MNPEYSGMQLATQYREVSVINLHTQMQLKSRTPPKSVGRRFILDLFVSLAVTACTEGDGVSAGAKSAAAADAFTRSVIWTAACTAAASSPCFSSIAAIAYSNTSLAL